MSLLNLHNADECGGKPAAAVHGRGAHQGRSHPPPLSPRGALVRAARRPADLQSQSARINQPTLELSASQLGAAAAAAARLARAEAGFLRTSRSRPLPARGAWPPPLWMWMAVPAAAKHRRNRARHLSVVGDAEPAGWAGGAAAARGFRQ